MKPIYFRITIFLQKSPPQNTKTVTSNLARLLKQLHLPFLRNMANTMVLLQVVIICCTSHSSTLSMASTLNAIPTTEFTPTQFHIQTDDGENRFFKYQTWSGQFRKETRLDDGAIVGSYGWVDANGVLRVYEYRADKAGYRITKSAMFNVGQSPEEDQVSKKEALKLRENQLITKRQKIRTPVFQRRKSPFDKTSIDHERELSNDIFGDQEALPVEAVSSKPVVVSLRRRRKPQQPFRQLRRPPLIPFIKRHRNTNINRLKKVSSLDFETERNDITGPVSSSRLQRRISTPDGGIKTVNVEPIFDDDNFLEQNTLQTNIPRKIIDNGDDIIEGPSLHRPSGRVILNTPHRKRFKSFRRRQQRKLRRPLNNDPGKLLHSESSGGAFVIRRRGRPRTRIGRIPMTRQKESVLETTTDDAGQGVSSVNYATTNTFHHENTFGDGQRYGQYGYIDPIGVRRVVTYTTGPRAPSTNEISEGITKIKENDYYGTNTYFKAN